MLTEAVAADALADDALHLAPSAARKLSAVLSLRGRCVSGASRAVRAEPAQDGEVPVGREWLCLRRIVANCGASPGQRKALRRTRDDEYANLIGHDHELLFLDILIAARPVAVLTAPVHLLVLAPGGAR